MTISFNPNSAMDPRSARYYENLMQNGHWNEIDPIYINKDTKMVVDGNHKLAAALNVNEVDKLKFRQISDGDWEKIRKISDRTLFLKKLYQHSKPIKKPDNIKKTSNLFNRDITGGQVLPGEFKEMSLSLILKNILFESVSKLVDDIKDKYNPKSFQLYEHGNDIVLGLIVLGKEHQGKGIGSKIMNDICEYADRNKKRILLTPAIKDKHHGTTSQSRLIDFYKRFGFVLNKGRNKDFSISELMYREPK